MFCDTHFYERLFIVGPDCLEQQEGVISGYSVKQLVLDLLVWLPGERQRIISMPAAAAKGLPRFLFLVCCFIRDGLTRRPPGWP